MQFDFMIQPEFENCSGIYSISNNLNKKIYIGRTSNFLKRYKEHRYKMKNGGVNYKFASFLEENPNVRFMFNLVEITDNLKDREEFYIASLDAVENGYNVLYTDSDFMEMRGKFKKFRTGKVKKHKRKKDKMLIAYEEFEAYIKRLLKSEVL